MHKTLFLVIFSVGMLSIAKVSSLKRQVITFPEVAKHVIYSAISECAASKSKAVELMAVVTQGKVLEDDEFKTFVHCAFMKSGYAFENGRVNIDKSISLYPDPVVMQKVMMRCDEERGKTPKETTFAFFKCFQLTSPYLIGTA